MIIALLGFLIFVIALVVLPAILSQAVVLRNAFYLRRYTRLMSTNHQPPRGLLTADDAHTPMSVDGQTVRYSAKLKGLEIEHTVTCLGSGWPVWFAMSIDGPEIHCHVQNYPVELHHIAGMSYPNFKSLLQINWTFTKEIKRYSKLLMKHQCFMTLNASTATLVITHPFIYDINGLSQVMGGVLKAFSSKVHAFYDALPDEPWLFWMMVYNNNPVTHPVRAQSLAILMRFEAQQAQVQSLWAEAIEQMPAPLLVDVFNSRPSLAAAVVNDVTWTTTRWLAMVAAIHKLEHPLHQLTSRINQRALEALGHENLHALTREDRDVLLPLSLWLWDTHPELGSTLLILAKQWLLWMPTDDAVHWLDHLANTVPIPWHLEHFDPISKRVLSPEQRQIMARLLCLHVGAEPQRVSTAQYASRVIAYLPFIELKYVPILGEAIIEHIHLKSIGDLSNATTQPPGSTSPLGLYLLRNWPTLTERVKTDAQHGGLSISDAPTQDGRLSLTQKGQLTEHDW